MSEKNNVNSKHSIEDEFLKKNLPSNQFGNKICPRCGKIYSDENILFCYYDGTKLTFTTQQAPISTSRVSPFQSDFSGFELNLQNSAHNVQIPIEIFQTTMRLLQTNPKMPLESDNVRTWFWTIPTPKKNRNFLIKLVNNVGFSRTNLFSYLLCYILIIITYGLWITNVDSSLLADLTIAKPTNFLIVGITCFIVLVVLILPILSLGYTESDVLQASRKDFYLRLEPTLLITILILNYLIFYFGGPLPILIIPGEPKVKVAPPNEHLVSSIKRSIYPSVLISLLSFAAFLAVQEGLVNVTSFVEKNIEIATLFIITILILELIPFGSSIGKILARNKPKIFYVSFFIITAILMVMISMVKLP